MGLSFACFSHLIAWRERNQHVPHFLDVGADADIWGGCFGLLEMATQHLTDPLKSEFVKGKN